MTTDFRSVRIVAAPALMLPCLLALHSPAPTAVLPLRSVLHDATQWQGNSRLDGPREPRQGGGNGVAHGDTLPLYREYQVEEPVTVVAWPRPQYPDSLKSAKIEGEVLVQFAVDTSGRLERATVRIVRASHPAFGRAVSGTLAGARFTPAVREGRRVRQLVQQNFVFATKR